VAFFFFTLPLKKYYRELLDYYAILKTIFALKVDSPYQIDYFSQYNQKEMHQYLSSPFHNYECCGQGYVRFKNSFQKPHFPYVYNKDHKL